MWEAHQHALNEKNDAEGHLNDLEAAEGWMLQSKLLLEGNNNFASVDDLEQLLASHANLETSLAAQNENFAKLALLTEVMT